MDLQGSKTTKQGLLGSPLAAHGISLGVFHEFSDSLSRHLSESAPHALSAALVAIK
jgi:hypothetical protein